MKKRNFKGFTLVELIVVIAIFSILMLAVLKLVDPVSKIHKSASEFEKTYAYVDNVQDYLQDSLRYADNLWVYQGNYNDAALATEVQKYLDDYYKGTVIGKGTSDTVYTEGTIRIMTILNNPVLDGSGNVQYEKGQILMNEVTYKADPTFSITNIGTSKPQLNPDFFSNDFSFEYIIGSSQLVSNGTSTAIVESMKPENATNMQTYLASHNFNEFALGIVTYNAKDYADAGTLAQGEYPFGCQYSVATLPLVNIGMNNEKNPRKGEPNSYYIYGKDAHGNIDTDVIELQSVTGKKAFQTWPTNISLNCDDNIYIIYSLSDEVNLPQ